jgi:hypothetical protein
MQEILASDPNNLGVVSSTECWSKLEQMIMARQYKACLKKVKGSPTPPSFLDELVDWASYAPDVIFISNAKNDIYSNVLTDLGPYTSTLHRKAVMLEVLRVLAGIESTWHWNQGVDTSKKKKNTPQNEETGAFQVSLDGIGNDASLKDFVKKTFGKTDTKTFITNMKTNHKFAIEYAARLFMVTTAANGPLGTPEFHSALSRDAVDEFMGFIFPWRERCEVANWF